MVETLNSLNFKSAYFLEGWRRHPAKQFYFIHIYSYHRFVLYIYIFI